MAAALAMAAPVQAQDNADIAAAQAPGGLEEIIVTARKVSENVQNTPLSITAISADKIEQQGVLRLSGLAQLAPNLKVTEASGSANSPVVFIRGIGTFQTVLYGEPAIGIYLDGVYTPRPQGNAFDLPDIGGVEVLRGPQGTLFGRNTVGGAILIKTSTPTDDAGGKVSAGYGSNNEVTFAAVLNTGLIGQSQWKAKLAAQTHSRDGWVRTPGYSKDTWGGSQKDLSLGFALVGELGALTIDNRVRYARNESFSG